MKVALLITTYNSPDVLNLVIASVADQTRRPDEVIICDDGSDQSTTSIISYWLNRLPIRHTWSPDINFRAASTRNLGISKSRAEVLIFVDGDCLIPPTFVEQHLELSQPGYLISGGRHLLTSEKTRSILKAELTLSSIFNNWKFLNLPFGILRDLGPKNWESVRTCNLSVYRQDVVRIAGFDESYVGWGHEDSDFVVRLIRSGIKIRSGRLAACVAHMYHSERSRASVSSNVRRFRETMNNPNHVMATSSVLSL